MFIRGVEENIDEYLVNLVDCPGHIDFASEVSTASRLCDGALVLVDAVEGVCTQTHSVLLQAWKERIQPILVINKMDRLIIELKMTALEAYTHVAKIIQQANAVLGTFYQSGLAHMDTLAHQRAQSGREVEDPGEKEIDCRLKEEDIYFSPQRGNVILASAIHGWAFRCVFQTLNSQFYVRRLRLEWQYNLI
jgi:ribosome assembly protein 1